MPEERYARRSARVLLDGSGRVLLLKLAGELGTSWITPGGGVDDGEPLPVAAARELREEVGRSSPTGEAERDIRTHVGSVAAGSDNGPVHAATALVLWR